MKPCASVAWSPKFLYKFVFETYHKILSDECCEEAVGAAKGEGFQLIGHGRLGFNSPNIN
jgi:hypothetical protein